MMKAESLILVITTIPNKTTAEDISRKLLQDGLAACIQIEKEVSSHYRWQGELVIENECRLTIKSTASQWNAIKQFIGQCHPYEIPEIVKVNIDECSDNYRNWIASQTKQNL